MADLQIETEEENTETLNEEKEEKEVNLWVEKYRPRFYTDLLSDDGVNRTLLTWLKLWDHVVFCKSRVFHTD